MTAAVVKKQMERGEPARASKQDDKYSGIVPDKTPVEDAILTFAPEVPPPIKRKHPAVVRVKLITDSAVGNISHRYKYLLWRFNKNVPGPFIRVRQGDTLDLEITNIDETSMPHNIDLHAVMGPGGGAALTNVELDQTKRATFKMLYSGLYVYHCAAAPVPLHVANGMYGLILVEPEEGMPPVDREFYVMQSEFYVDKESEEDDVVEVSYQNGLREQPEVVCFNGREGSLTDGKGMLRANTGDKVRIYFGNGGPNLISSFHVIGAVFEKVYREGDLVSPPARNLQTTLVPAGGATVVEFTPIVPGNYTLVDHSIFRLDKGAVGFLAVSGPQNPSIYHSDQAAAPCPGCKLHA